MSGKSSLKNQDNHDNSCKKSKPAEVSKSSGQLSTSSPNSETAKQLDAKKVVAMFTKSYANWSSLACVREFHQVYADIYAPIKFSGGDVLAKPKLRARFKVDLGLTDVDQTWKRALEKIKKWKERCRKSTVNPDQLIIVEHLKAVETFLHIVLQMLNPGDCSLLYDLYGRFESLWSVS